MMKVGRLEQQMLWRRISPSIVSDYDRQRFPRLAYLSDAGHEA